MARRSEGGSRRRTAEERRRLVIEAARAEFAAVGLYGATGEAISYRAGISHPYLLRLFGSKRDLFLAVVDDVFDELSEVVPRVVAEIGDEASIPALESGLRQELSANHGLLSLLQFCVACADDEVRPAVRRRFAEFYEQLERGLGASEAEAREVVARLLLAGAAEAMRLPEAATREHWARRVLGADLTG
jgi:AcrR family transcriptional regulator